MTEISLKKTLHFRHRLSQRHGITLSDKAFHLFCQARVGRGASIQLSCRLGVHKVDFAGIIIAVLWDRKHDVPVTTLPESAIIYGTKQSYQWDGERFLCVKNKRKGVKNGNPRRRSNSR